MIVSVRIFLAIPETNRYHFVPLRGNQGDFILKSLLFAQQGNYLLRQNTPKLLHALGPELNSDVARVHSLSSTTTIV